jgi:hypothetical protein
MSALFAISTALRLSPSRLNNNIPNIVKDRYGPIRQAVPRVRPLLSHHFWCLCPISDECLPALKSSSSMHVRSSSPPNHRCTGTRNKGDIPEDPPPRARAAALRSRSRRGDGGADMVVKAASQSVCHVYHERNLLDWHVTLIQLISCPRAPTSGLSRTVESCS